MRYMHKPVMRYMHKPVMRYMHKLVNLLGMRYMHKPRQAWHPKCTLSPRYPSQATLNGV
jgi:hypothetical protein